jgi:CRP-like cAMP-binding protein
MRVESKTDFAGDIHARKGCLSVLSPPTFSLLKPHLAEVNLHEGTILWESKDLAACVYFPLSGLLSIVLAMAEGECVEVGSIGREAAAGIFDPDHLPLLTRGTVRIAGTFLRISSSELARAARQNDEVKNLIAVCQDWILMQAQQLAACNAAHSADKRFCRWLVESYQRIGEENVHVTQESIAAVLGIRRTTVTLIAQTLQENGSIKYRRGNISILDLPRLRAAACECCETLDQRYWPSIRLAQKAK